MAQLFHDRKQREARSGMSIQEKAKTPYIDCASPQPTVRAAVADFFYGASQTCGPSLPTPTLVTEV